MIATNNDTRSFFSFLAQKKDPFSPFFFLKNYKNERAWKIMPAAEYRNKVIKCLMPRACKWLVLL